MGVGAVLYMYDVVVKKVHFGYLISWWVSCWVISFTNKQPHRNGGKTVPVTCGGKSNKCSH